MSDDKLFSCSGLVVTIPVNNAGIKGAIEIDTPTLTFDQPY